MDQKTRAALARRTAAAAKDPKVRAKVTAAMRSSNPKLKTPPKTKAAKNGTSGWLIKD